MCRSFLHKLFPAFALSALALTALPGDARALNCPSPFAMQDRTEVAYRLGLLNEQFLNTVALATWSCQGGLSNPQMMALDSEYQARVASISGLDGALPNYLQPESVTFIESIFNSTLRSLHGSSVLGAESACIALRKNSKLQRDVLRCYGAAVGQAVKGS